MNEPFVVLLTAALVSRLVLIFRDGPITRKDVALMLVVQTGSVLLLEIDVGKTVWWALLLSPALIDGSLFWLERRYRRGDRNVWRMAALVAQTLLLAILCSPLFDLKLAGPVHDLVRQSPPGQAASTFLNAVVVLAGALFAANEANILIRLVIRQFGLEPKKRDSAGSGETDEREYHAGRIIGILERIIIYVLVLKQQYTAIGFVLAAKSFARFREMDDRETAEYILIGTLLSALLAMLTGVVVAMFLP